jgi:hypothetical protein
MEDEQRLREIITTWLMVGYPDQAPSPADAMHSALLGRLIAGQKPLPYRPPRSYSYPWYQLCDEGHVDGVEVDFFSQQEVAINQSIWNIDQEITAGQAYLVSWGEEGGQAKLERRSELEFNEEIDQAIKENRFGWSEDKRKELLEHLRERRAWSIKLVRVPQQGIDRCGASTLSKS